MKSLLIVASGLLLAGCAYQVATQSSPQLDVYSNYTTKVPGKWALFVDASGLSKDVHSEGFACSAHSFPMDLRSAFQSSVVATFQNLADVEVVDQAPPMQGQSDSRYDGTIVIKAEDLRTKLNFIPGFWSGKADATVELDAGMIVDGRAGRLIGTRASGSGNDVGDSGFYCGGSSKVISDAAESAMKNLLGTLGERFSNAPQIRDIKSR